MSERPDDATRSAEAWLAYADNDLAMAARGLQPPPITEMVCYHAEQAAEKALKAYIVWLSEERVPRHHRLRELAQRVVALGGAQAPHAPLAVLEDYAVEVRYPEVPWPSLAEAERALELGKEVVAWARQVLGLEREQ
ncbi:MAG: HEPN domain-containing protein [Armatimonadetes bacterium]|nr:HEPN domain-containing protein [Armatimonadota bacterium]